MTGSGTGVACAAGEAWAGAGAGAGGWGERGARDRGEPPAAAGASVAIGPSLMRFKRPPLSMSSRQVFHLRGTGAKPNRGRSWRGWAWQSTSVDHTTGHVAPSWAVSERWERKS